MTKVLLRWLVPVPIALLTGCSAEAPPPDAVQPAPTFQLVRIADVVLYPERNAPAAVIGKHEARLAAEVAATIRALPVDVGQTVKRGAVVVQLDPRDAALALERTAAALAQAEARHRLAQVQLERARALREKNFYSAEALTLRETELLAAAADLRAATAQRDSARHVLDKHTLRAPFAAVVRSRTAQLGELASPGSVLLTLVDQSELLVAAQLQPADADTLRQAAAPVFSAAGENYPLQLLRISPALNRDSRSFEARLVFIGPPPAAGLEGRLLWRERQAYLPADLLVRRAGQLGVFVATEGKARLRVLPEAQEGRPAAIDLHPEAQIVSQGRHALQDGMSIK